MYANEFRERGFVVLRGFFSKEEIAPLRDEILKHERASQKTDALTDGGLVFTTNIFKESALVREFLTQQRLLDFICPIAGPDLWVRWDQSVSKYPGAGVFRWHQDNGYNGVQSEHYQLWIALTESQKQNGALWLAPGSHKRGALRHAVAASNQMEVTDSVGETVCVDAMPGDIILFSSYMLHRTGPNDADTNRTAYVAEYFPKSEYDPAIEGPYFMVTDGGKRNPHFVSRQPGELSLRNQLLYMRPRLRRVIETSRRLRQLRDAVRALVRRPA